MADIAPLRLPSLVEALEQHDGTSHPLDFGGLDRIHLNNWTGGRKPVVRKPLRSFSELADQLGVRKDVLRLELAGPNAPQEVKEFRKGGTRGSQRWYEPGEVRRWWSALQDSRASAVEPLDIDSDTDEQTDESISTRPRER